MCPDKGLDIYEYEARDEDNYRTGRHRTLAYEHLLHVTANRLKTCTNKITTNMKWTFKIKIIL